MNFFVPLFTHGLETECCRFFRLSGCGILVALFEWGMWRGFLLSNVFSLHRKYRVLLFPQHSCNNTRDVSVEGPFIIIECRLSPFNR